MSIILSLDASEWQGRLGQAQFDYAYAAGVRLYIAQLFGSGPTGLGTNDYAEDQLGFAKASGMALAGYLWVPPDDTTKTESLVEASLTAAGRYVDELAFVAPDLEGGKLHPTNPVGRLMDVCQNLTLANKRIVIYTSKRSWPNVMGAGVSEFSQYPLWEARYWFKSGYKPDEAPNIDWKWAPFGGWKQRSILQYAGTAPVNGWSADWNVVDESRLGFSLGDTPTPTPTPTPESPAPMPESEEELTVGQYVELKKLIGDSREFTQRVHDAIVERLAKAEAATVALTSHVATITPAPHNYPRTKEYTVKSGDTLTKIAKTELGQAGRFTEIATMNYDRYPSLKADANMIQIGWVLRLPA